MLRTLKDSQLIGLSPLRNTKGLTSIMPPGLGGENRREEYYAMCENERERKEKRGES